MLAYPAGLVLGLANAARHRLRGYTAPRPFATSDLERSVTYAMAVGRRWQRYVDIRGKRILELGPGPDLGTGAVLLADGAASYHAVDAFPLADRDLAPFFRALSQQIGEVDSTRLGYQIAGFPGLEEVDSDYDLILSHATLEHVENVPALFHRLRVLAPHGAMCHQIDPITHIRWIRQRDPWNILRYSDRLYRLMRFPGAPNRMLADDYATAASEAGFDSVAIFCEQTASHDYLRRVDGSLPKQFAGRDDLRIVGFTMTAS